MLGTGGTYTSHAILGNTCAYDAVLGLKTSSSFWSKNPNNSLQFVLDRTETFGYDPNLDYLTNASYNDGMPNPTQYWTYDAAGNRNDSVCDNLNRAASIGGVACTNDILGNRLTKGTTTYNWDDLNRMVGLANSSFQTSYVYRADGMRATKTGFDGEETRFTRYRYDGQMGIEDFETRDNNQVNGVRSVLTQHGLGARGIDFIRTTTVTGSGVNQQTQAVDSYPVYDAHGNMVATLSKSGTNDYALSNQRSFDAWGNVRIGSSTGNPTGRYCANIGHRQDDESGLIYMRARYYEPTSGRFVSEDPAADGSNWFVYCGNDPVNYFDQSGKLKDTSWAWAIYFSFTFLKDWLYDRDPKELGIFLLCIGGGIALNEVSDAKGWVKRVANKVFAWYRLGWIKNPDNVVFKMSRKNAIEAFYIGYALSILIISEVLEDEISQL